MSDTFAPSQSPHNAPDASRGDTQTRRVTAEVRGQGGLRGVATWTITSLTDRARFKRAAKTSAILLGMAVAVAPIPPIHWVLVPGFLIASVIAFFVRMGTSELVTGKVVCPKCQASFELESQPPTWPLDLTCHACRAQLTASLLP